MKNLKSKLLMIALLLLAMSPVFAVSLQTDVSEPLSPATIVGYLTTFIALGVTFLWRKFKVNLSGQATLFIVAGVTFLTTLVTQWLGNPDIGWWGQLGLGVASTFLHQFYLKLTGADKK